MEENKSIKSNLLNFNAVEEKIITIRDTQVIIDSDVAALYGVQTKEINQAVKNNPDKFPQGYLIEIDNKEFIGLRSKILTANMAKTRVLPKAFTEKGLYMLATILKSPAATRTTIAIVEAFAKMRELSRVINELHDSMDDKVKQKSLMQKSGELISDLLDDGLKTTNTETSIEINLALLKLKHTVKRKSE